MHLLICTVVVTTIFTLKYGCTVLAANHYHA